MSTTVSAIYERGVLRPLKPLNLPEHSRVHIQILTDDIPSNEVSFSQCLSGLRQLLASLEQDWSNDLVRQLFPQLLRADLRTLWHFCRPFQQELCAMLELAAAHLHPDSLTHDQVAAIRFGLDLRSVWSDYVRVYDEILQHDHWEATVQALRSGAQAYRPRSLGRCLQILTQAMVASRLERDHVLDLLETQITHDLPRRFWRHVTPLPDPIGCDLIAAGVTRQPDGTYIVADTCRKESAICHLPDFLAGHRSELRTVADHLAGHPNAIKDQARVERLLAAVLDDPRAALG